MVPLSRTSWCKHKPLRSTIPDHKSSRKGVEYWDAEDDFVFQLPDEADAQPETAAAGS